MVVWANCPPSVAFGLDCSRLGAACGENETSLWSTVPSAMHNGLRAVPFAAHKGFGFAPSATQKGFRTVPSATHKGFRVTPFALHRGSLFLRNFAFSPPKQRRRTLQRVTPCNAEVGSQTATLKFGGVCEVDRSLNIVSSRCPDSIPQASSDAERRAKSCVGPKAFDGASSGSCSSSADNFGVIMHNFMNEGLGRW